MTRKTWSDVDISSYVDGELEPEPQTALEADIARDPALRRRVEEMQQVTNLVRAMPLREPPRNYLLTPSMVAEADPKPQPSRRRIPLGLMRLASSLVAIAFVISFGLTMLQRGMTPAMVTQSESIPEAASLRQEDVQLAEAPQAPPDDAASAKLQDAPEIAQSEAVEAPAAEQGDLAPQDEMALEPMPEGGQMGGDVPRGQGGGGEGIGGGEPVDETPAAMMVAPVEEGTPAPMGTPDLLEKEGEAEVETATTEETVEMHAAEAEAPDATGSGENDVPNLGEEASDPPGDLAYDEAEGDLERTIRRGLPRLSPWIPAGLGAATAVLVALTFWMAKRRS
jgi:hypothetical protein